MISWLQSTSTVILELKKIKSVTASNSPPPFTCHEVMGPLSQFLNVVSQASFSVSSFTLIKKLFSFSSLSAIRVVSPAYPRLLLFIQAILIPACDSSSLAFHMMYPTCRGFLGGAGSKDSEKVTVAQLCLTHCDPIARILEWVAISFSRASSQAQGSNPGLPHCRRILYQLSYKASL